MSTTIRVYTKDEITSLTKAINKVVKDYNRAIIEASYARKMLRWHKQNLSVAQMDGEEKIDTIIDLEEKVKEQTDTYNKCYAEWSDLLDLYTKEVNSYSDVMNDYKKQPDHDEYDEYDYDCRVCGKNFSECGEDHGDELRDMGYARR